nr:AbiH family protein [uncultured Clostridium sp.]
MSNILVIGNGFDIAHGLKTSYSDYIKTVKLIKNKKITLEDLENRDIKRDDLFNQFRDITKENCFLSHFIHCNDIEDSWCGIEGEIEKVINVWIDILDNVTVKGRINNWNSEMEFVMCSFSDFIQVEEEADIVNKKSKLFKSGVYRDLVKMYINERGINKDSLINKLKIELNNFIKSFELYLQLFVEKVTPDQYLNLSVLSPGIIVNFNYTETHKIYKLFSENDESRVKYIHGKIGSEPNNMVMGMNVFGNDYNRDFVYFMKFFQRIQHKSDILRVKDLFQLNLKGSNHKPSHKQKKQHWQKVYFIGHSMSNADGDVIRLLKSPVSDEEEFEIESTFIIYYYNQKDYEQKVINLFEVFGKDETIQMIHDDEIEFVPLETIMLK